VNPQVSQDGAGQPRQFATTRWSLILSAVNSQSEEQNARDALEELCRIYWRPVFAFCLPARLFNAGRAGSYARFFREDIGTYLPAARRRKSGPVPFPLAQLAPEFSHYGR